MRQGIQQTVMEIMDGSPKHAISRYVEWLITVVVLINCTAVILDSVPEIHAVYKDFFHELEFWSVMFFTAEYVIRVWALGGLRQCGTNDQSGRSDCTHHRLFRRVYGCDHDGYCGFGLL